MRKKSEKHYILGEEYGSDVCSQLQGLNSVENETKNINSSNIQIEDTSENTQFIENIIYNVTIFNKKHKRKKSKKHDIQSEEYCSADYSQLQDPNSVENETENVNSSDIRIEDTSENMQLDGNDNVTIFKTKHKRKISKKHDIQSEEYCSADYSQLHDPNCVENETENINRSNIQIEDSSENMQLDGNIIYNVTTFKKKHKRNKYKKHDIPSEEYCSDDYSQLQGPNSIENETEIINSSNIPIEDTSKNMQLDGNDNVTTFKKKHKRRKSKKHDIPSEEYCSQFESSDTIEKESKDENSSNNQIGDGAEADNTQLKDDDNMHFSKKKHKRKKSGRQDLECVDNDQNTAKKKLNSKKCSNVAKVSSTDDVQFCKRKKSNPVNTGCYSNIGSAQGTIIDTDDDDDEQLTDYDSEFDTNSNIRDDVTHRKWACFNDFVEEPVDFDIPRLHQLQSKKFNKTMKEKLLEEGVKIREGRWTKQEEKILLKNWKVFTKKFKMDDPACLLGINAGRSNTTCKKYKKFVNAKYFLVRLGKGLNDRTLMSVYYKARSLLNPGSASSQMTDEEVGKLCDYQQRFGNKWARIGKLMNKTPSQCRITFQCHRKHTAGMWSSKENKRLKAAFEEVFGDEYSEVSYQNARGSWVKIASLVKTRDASQCYTHWKVKRAVCSPIKFTKEWRACLIYILHQNIVEDQSLVDWNCIYPPFKTVVPSPFALRKKWNHWKCSFPILHSKSHRECVNFVFEREFERLLKKASLTLKEVLSRTKIPHS